MCNGNKKVCKIWCKKKKKKKKKQPKKIKKKKKKKKLSYLARYKLSILIITLVKIELNIIEIDHTE